MAITVGNVSSTAFDGSTSTTFSWSHTTAAGSDRALYVAITKWESGGPLVSSVTYGGSALTRVASSNASSGGDRSELWRLLTPPAGAATVLVTRAGATFLGGVFGAIDLAGVHQTTPEGAADSATGSSTTPSVTLSATSGNLVVDAMAADGSTNTTNTLGGGQTAVYNAESGDERCHASREAGASSVTMSSTLNGSASWAICAVEVEAAGAAATPSLVVLHPRAAARPLVAR